MSPQPTIGAPKFSADLTRAMQIYALGNFAWNIYKLLSKTPPEVKLQKTPWRPAEWSKVARPLILVDSSQNVYIFDAIFKLDHLDTIRATEHPVQNGTSIVDHAYAMPDVLTFELGMSDAMDNYFTESQDGSATLNGNAKRWSSGEDKSYSAYQTLKQLKNARQPFTVLTRLNNYKNMIIERILAPDDVKTLHGLKCTVTMRQLITAEVSNTTVKISKRPQVTNSTPKGNAQASDVNASALSKMETAMGF